MFLKMTLTLSAFFVTLSFTSNLVLAEVSCPSFAGKYAKCQSNDPEDKGARDVVITEKTQDNITTYFIESTDNESGERNILDLVADGQPHSIEVGDNPGDVMITTVNCAQDVVKVNDKVVINEQIVANLDSTAFKQGNKFIYSTEGNVWGDEVKISMVCE